MVNILYMYGVLSVFQYKKVPSKRETAQLGVDITPQKELFFFESKVVPVPDGNGNVMTS